MALSIGKTLFIWDGSMKNKYQALEGNTVKLGLGTFGAKLLVFLMVRFYTEYLSPADYGTADLITQTANLLIPLLSLGITDAVFRFAMDETADAAGIFTAGVLVLLAGSALAGVLARMLRYCVPLIPTATILLIAGVYLPVIQAIKAFLGLDLSVVPGLCALGFGILAGIGLSIHAIRAALRKYRPQMVWFILGLMAGSLYAIIMGPAGLDTPQAPVSLQSFNFIGFALGAALLLGLELLRKWTTQQTASKTISQKRTAT